MVRSFSLGDPNPADEGPDAGTDLDLHFAHPNASQSDLNGDGAPDPWFDPIWDVFWFYPDQNWGSVTSNDDNPSMIRDDVDTLGPETIALAVAEEGKAYAIGVNVWDDHGYGDSYATVRVSVYGSPLYESPDVELTEHELAVAVGQPEIRRRARSFERPPPRAAGSKERPGRPHAPKAPRTRRARMEGAACKVDA